MPSFAISSRWLAAATLTQTPLYLHWLQRPGALTHGLRQIGQVVLRVVDEYPDHVDAGDSAVLERPTGSPIWVREIAMAIDGTDCVVARSITPLAASNDQWAGMRRLQTRPLADMLYTDTDITRSRFYACRLQDGDPLHATLRHALGGECPAADHVLARSSVFWRGGEPLMVAECFLPEFWSIAPPTS